MSSLTGRLFGHYRILERIGRGGMATVYHADDRKSGADVAIKFISPALAENEDFLKRFRREVKLVAGLDHPNIVPVFDYGEQEGYAYVVMPRLRLGSLADRIKQAPLSLEAGGKLLDQVAAALDYAHRHGIVHRDVKPSNILLDGDGNALLGDFGLARSDKATFSLTGSALIGTPAYIAPELVRGEKADVHCDQYSLGVILFELATGTLPFDATTPIAAALKHVSEPFPFARSRSPNVPESVERVILRATAKNPSSRFASISEMNAALQAALAHAHDPTVHHAPTIELPPAGLLAPSVSAPVRRAGRLRPVQVAAIGFAVLLIGLAVPVFASGVLSLLERAASPAESGRAESAEPSAGQLTAQVATIAALSTQLASVPGRSLQPGEVQTAVMQTLAALGEPGASVESTPDLAVGFALANASGTASPGSPSPTSPSSQTPAAGPGPAGPPTPTPATATAGPPTPATASTTQPAAPTSTQVPTPLPPTSTPKPPTPVPTEDTCALLSLGGFGKVAEKEVGWLLNNSSSTTVTVTRIVLDWPEANVGLNRILFDTPPIWNGDDDSPPTDTQSENGLQGNRKLGGPDAPPSKTLQFRFDGAVQDSGYELEVYLGPGCVVSAGG
ncbi:MAG: serine/threonine-protein kinase [Anaerolineales bacterium]